MVSFMSPKSHIDVRLTLPETKALARLVKIRISAIEADDEPVSTPVILRRAVESCKSGLHKIETAIGDAKPVPSRKNLETRG